MKTKFHFHNSYIKENFTNITNITNITIIANFTISKSNKK